jgi:hypothetical protein
MLHVFVRPALLLKVSPSLGDAQALVACLFLSCVALGTLSLGEALPLVACIFLSCVGLGVGKSLRV